MALVAVRAASAFPSLAATTVPARTTAARPREGGTDPGEPKKKRAEKEAPSRTVSVGRGTAAQPLPSASGSIGPRLDRRGEASGSGEVPRSAPSGNESGSGEVPRFAPSVTSSEWMEGEALEDALDILTHDKLKEITWLGPPPHVGRGRDAALTTFVLLDHKAVLCNLLGVGASRVVYSVGTAHAIKYE